LLVVIPFAVYFGGPFLLAYLIGRRRLGAGYHSFAYGLLGFLLPWTIISLVTGAAGKGGAAEGTFLYALIISASAGFFEELNRFIIFKFARWFRDKRDWKNTAMYAIGHSGMESIIVGGTIILAMVVIKFTPDLLPAETLDSVMVDLDVGFGTSLYNSLERLLVGLLIHACFTCLVVLGLIRSDRRYLYFAMLWHFAHNMVSFNLHFVSEHWLAARIWVAAIVVVYTWALLRLRKMMRA
jgi:uncharacterized membrane protein YhfC